MVNDQVTPVTPPLPEFTPELMDVIARMLDERIASQVLPVAQVQEPERTVLPDAVHPLKVKEGLALSMLTRWADRTLQSHRGGSSLGNRQRRGTHPRRWTATNPKARR